MQCSRDEAGQPWWQQAFRGLYEEKRFGRWAWSQLNTTVFYYEQHKRFKS
jgi:hypothetical protein